MTMPNNPEENKLAIKAFELIEAKYGEYLHKNPSIINFSKAMKNPKTVEAYVKFRDSDVFMRNCLRLPKLDAGCRINGFTCPRSENPYDREIFINRESAIEATVVHEMLHFLTHPRFMYLHRQIIEAVTEFFTRQVINASEIQYRVYDLEHSVLTEQKNRTSPDRLHLKKAYFGDEEAIKFVRDQLKDLPSEVNRRGATQKQLQLDFAIALARVEAAEESDSQQPSVPDLPPRPPRLDVPPRPPRLDVPPRPQPFAYVTHPGPRRRPGNT